MLCSGIVRPSLADTTSKCAEHVTLCSASGHAGTCVLSINDARVHYSGVQHLNVPCGVFVINHTCYCMVVLQSTRKSLPWHSLSGTCSPSACLRVDSSYMGHVLKSLCATVQPIYGTITPQKCCWCINLVATLSGSPMTHKHAALLLRASCKAIIGLPHVLKHLLVVLHALGACVM